MATKKNPEGNVVKIPEQIPANDQREVTPVNDLVRYSQGMLVDLPSFGPGMPFRARVRRPSILALAKEGSIPNTLLASASELFVTGRIGNKPDTKDNALRDMYMVCEIMAKAALIEPKYDEITKAGVQLTDQQLMAIFSFTQEGVSALDAFRQE